MNYSGLITLGASSCSLTIFQPKDEVTAPSYKYKYKVRLLEGVSATGRLRDDKLPQLIECFEDMKAKLAAKQVTVEKTHIFATAPFRQMQRPALIAEATYAVIPRNIQVLTAEQECHYIYQGAYATQAHPKPHLIIDIGGGSTELILGHEARILEQCSLPIGALNSQSMYLSQTVCNQGIARLQSEIFKAFAPFLPSFKAQSIDRISGASGIFQALASIRAQDQQPCSIHKLWLQQLIQSLQQQHVSMPKVKGLQSKRQPSFTGGLIILTTLLELLEVQEVQEVQLAQGALREGLLDMLLQHKT